MNGPAFDIDVRLSRPDFTLEAQFKTPQGLSVLFGPSGAGKTTLLSLITGMIRPDSGHIRISGETLFDAGQGIDLKIHKRGLGYVPQDMLLFPHLSARANLCYGMKDDRDAAFDDIVKLLDLKQLLERRPAQLSGGEQRRVALGRALLSSPRALLLDEPMAGLDPARRQRLLPFIERIHHEVRIPILYISHYAEEAVRLADHAIMLAEGKVVACGPAPAVFTDPVAESHFGPFDLGSVFDGRVTRHIDGLCVAQIPGAELIVNARALNVGDTIRLRILARDVAIALEPPQNTSVQNILPCTLTHMDEDPSGGVLVRLALGDDSMLSASITQQSARRLGLKPGVRVHAMIKAVAVARSRHPLAAPV